MQLFPVNDFDCKIVLNKNIKSQLSITIWKKTFIKNMFLYKF